MAKDPISVTHPEIAAQLVDQSLASKLTSGSNKKVEFICESGHVWLAKVANRTYGGNGCPYCSNQKVLIGYNDLATTHPEYACQLKNVDDAFDVTSGTSKKKLEWVCEDCGSTYSATPANRIANKSGCPYCDKKMVIVGVNDLATTHSEIAKMLVDSSLATKISSGSNKRAMFRCGICDMEFESAIVNMVKSKNNCPYCSGRYAIPGKTDLATVNPELSAQMVDQELSHEILPNSGREVEWLCPDCGQTWWDFPYHRSIGIGCPVCANKKVVAGFNDIATTHPDVAIELLDGSLANNIVAGSGKRVSWICKDGHVWETTPYHRCYEGTGCPICARNNYSSKAENEIYDFVCSAIGEDNVVKNDREVLHGNELDVYIPSKSLAIEYNGVYWHTEEMGKANSYHADKFHACEEAGIQLIQIFEDDWNNRKDVILDTLRHKLAADTDKVYARNTTFCKIDSSEARVFYDKNHMQGFVSSTAHYGLRTKDGGLVACMSFKSPRSTSRMKRPDGMWELIRFAASHSVVGGAGKLLKNAVEELRGLGCTSVVSFSDNTISNGGLYKTLGFRFDKELPADYRYVGSKTGWVRKPKEAFQKGRFKSNDNLLYKEGTTERELAKLNELYRIYDAGKRRWVLELN